MAMYKETIATKARDIASELSELNVNCARTVQSCVPDMQNNRKSPSLTSDEDSNYFMLTTHEAIEIITPFDGHNQSLENFIADISETKQLVEHSKQRYFLKLVLAKRIIGEAKRSIEEYHTNSYEELFSSLRTLFGGQQPISVWRNARAKCCQGKTETVINFSNRFVEIQNKIIASISDSTRDSTRRQYQIEFEQEQGLELFLDGLHIRYSTDVIALKPKNIREAITCAQKSEARYAKHQSLVENAEREKEHPRRDNGRTFKRENNVRSSRELPRCAYCKKLGHLERECRTKKWDDERQQYSSRRQSDQQSSQARQDFRRGLPNPNPPPRINALDTEQMEPHSEPDYSPYTEINELSESTSEA